MMLHGLGRQQMEQWLKQNKKYIGKESSIDIEEQFLKRSSNHHRKSETQ
jgi:hypothetical protein